MTKEEKTVAIKEFLTTPEASEFLGIQKNYLYKLTSSHQLPFYCPNGRKILFKRSELQAWIEQSRVPTKLELETQAQTEQLKKGGLK